jgi:hypothetical protein
MLPIAYILEGSMKIKNRWEIIFLIVCPHWLEYII